MPDHTAHQSDPLRRALEAQVYATNVSPVPPVDVRATLTDAILALNTLAHPGATPPRDWTDLLDRSGDVIAALDRTRDVLPRGPFRVEAVRELALTLLTMHEDEAISLDTWVEAREVVEAFFGPLEENGV